MNLKKRNKCIILVTNALQFLKSCSQIIVLRDGIIVESGKYDYLLATGYWLNEMIRTHMDSSNSNSISRNSSLINDITSGLTPEIDDASHKKAEIQNNINSIDIDEKLNLRNSQIDKKKDIKIVKDDNPGKTISLNALTNSGKLLSVEEKEVGDVSLKVFEILNYVQLCFLP